MSAVVHFQSDSVRGGIFRGGIVPRVAECDGIFQLQKIFFYLANLQIDEKLHLMNILLNKFGNILKLIP